MATALALAAHIRVICISTVHIIFISWFIPFELTKLAYSQNMGLHTVPQLVEHCLAKKEQGLNLIKALKKKYWLNLQLFKLQSCYYNGHILNSLT